ncbi:MAG: OmpA family protein [Bacteroidaceae bacterium]|nr:OmpA family protein [Prevotellaceae bacterium]MDY5632882.1 OmpA family protein [Bacteroidaceae bacterium]
MKGMKFSVVALCATMLLSGCDLTNKQKGALIGTAAGGAAGTGLGAGIGALIGGKKGAKLGSMIGAGVGVAAGATAGTLIGKKMDKAKAAAAALAQAETYTDANGLEGVKVTFDNGILFQTGKATLTTSAQNTLRKFAQNVLNVYNDVDVNVYGFASSDGSDATNLTLSQSRAQAVTNYLISCGVNPSQIRMTTGYGETPEYLVYNANGTENMPASRRVELYMYASEAMIQAANAGTLK